MKHSAVRLTCQIFALAVFALGDATAQEVHSRFRWDAFGSLGAVYHQEDGVTYRRNWEQPDSARSNELEFGTDSVLGGQVVARASDGVDVTLQAVSRLYPDNSWQPQVTRAFVRLEPDDSVMIRLGRIGLASQLDADSRYIGYSYLSIRPSQEVLSSVPVDSLNGADLRYRHRVGPGVGSVQAFYGKTRGNLHTQAGEAALGVTLSRGLILAYEGEIWQVRVYGGISTIQSNGASQPLIDALRALPQAAAIAEALDSRGAKVHFHGFDVDYSAGPLKLQGAYMTTDSNRTEVLLPPARNFALLAGYRFGRITPYLQYGRAMRANLTLAPLGIPALDSQVSAAIAGSRMDQATLGAGARFEVRASAAFKVQVDRISARESQQILVAGQPSGTDKQLTLLSVSLDFAF